MIYYSDHTKGMEEAPAFTESSDVSSPSYGYTDPISSFFGGIFFIIILFLFIVLIVVMLLGRAVGLVTDSPAPPPVTKEKFKDGPPYPSCKTNGALAMF